MTITGAELFFLLLAISTSPLDVVAREARATWPSAVLIAFPSLPTIGAAK